MAWYLKVGKKRLSRSGSGLLAKFGSFSFVVHPSFIWVGLLPLSEVLDLTGFAVSLVGSCASDGVVNEGSPFSASLAKSLLNSIGESVLLSESLMMVVMPLGGDASEVLNGIVGVVVVGVVDFISVGDGSVDSLPNPSAFKLLV